MFLKGGCLTLPTALPNPYYSIEVIVVWRVLFDLPLCVTGMCELCMHHTERTNSNYRDLFDMQQDDEAGVLYSAKKIRYKGICCAHAIYISQYFTHLIGYYIPQFLYTL